MGSSLDHEERVKKLVRKHKTNCPFTLAEALRVQLEFVDLPDNIRGFYTRILGHRVIVLNEKFPYEWQRYTCAHELGHDRLHRGISHYFLEEHTFQNPGKYEREANQFAIALLTFGSDPEEGEPVDQFFLRNEIPLEVIDRHMLRNLQMFSRRIG